MPQRIAIIGGGIIGCSIARRLALAGLSVVVVEARQIGAGASTAGAGMLAPGAEVTAGGMRAALGLESQAAYPEWVRAIERESGVAIDYRECGALDIALGEEEWEELRRRTQSQARLGIESDALSADRAAAMLPGAPPRGLTAALYYPRDAIVNPCDVMRALQASLRRWGVDVREGMEIGRLRATGGGVELEGRDGTLRADAAVLAAGAWSSEIRCEGAGDLPESFPVRGHLVSYPLSAGSLGPIVRHGHTYILQRAGGVTIAGTSEERVGFDSRVDDGTVVDIRERATALLPYLDGREITASWVGFRPGAAGSEPIVRRCGTAPLWLAYGHYRNGILMAPATAERIGAEIIATLGTA
jgi:glycine oxidase